MKKILMLIITVALVFTLGGCIGTSDEDVARIDDLEASLIESQDRIAELEEYTATVSQNQMMTDQHATQLTNLEDAGSMLAGELDTSNGDIETLQEALVMMAEGYDELDADIIDHTERIEWAEWYMEDNWDHILTLLEYIEHLHPEFDHEAYDAAQDSTATPLTSE